MSEDFISSRKNKKWLTDFCLFYIVFTACNAACEYVLTDVLNLQSNLSYRAKREHPETGIHTYPLFCEK